MFVSVLPALLLLLHLADAEGSADTRQIRKMTDEEALARARQVLDQYPLIDGHNDLPHQFRMRIANQIDMVNLTVDMDSQWGPSHTDIPRIREGQLSGQFWVAYVRCSKSEKDAVRGTLEQIDVIHRMMTDYADDFAWALNADDLETAFAAGKVGSMIGVEGGHSLDSSLAVLRLYYGMGVRYLGLTHNCDTDWSENNGDDEDSVPSNDGLTDWGRELITEMNRLGMIVDLSHVSKSTMVDAIEASVAPVIFSHSNAWALCNQIRNVQDDVLHMLAVNNGVIMVTFVPFFMNCYPSNDTAADIALAADHIDYIKNLIGSDHVGIGGDFDGMPNPAEGLQDVAQYPHLFAELVQRGWTDLELEKLAGRNLVRVYRDVEQVRDRLAAMRPVDTPIPQEDVNPENVCRTTF